jgi:hypothetical protein
LCKRRLKGMGNPPIVSGERKEALCEESGPYR